MGEKSASNPATILQVESSTFYLLDFVLSHPGEFAFRNTVAEEKDTRRGHLIFSAPGVDSVIDVVSKICDDLCARGLDTRQRDVLGCVVIMRVNEAGDRGLLNAWARMADIRTYKKFSKKGLGLNVSCIPMMMKGSDLSISIA